MTTKENLCFESNYNNIFKKYIILFQNNISIKKPIIHKYNYEKLQKKITENIQKFKGNKNCEIYESKFSQQNINKVDLNQSLSFFHEKNISKLNNIKESTIKYANKIKENKNENEKIFNKPFQNYLHFNELLNKNNKNNNIQFICEGQQTNLSSFDSKKNQYIEGYEFNKVNLLNNLSNENALNIKQNKNEKKFPKRILNSTLFCIKKNLQKSRSINEIINLRNNKINLNNSTFLLNPIDSIFNQTKIKLSPLEIKNKSLIIDNKNCSLNTTENNKNENIHMNSTIISRNVKFNKNNNFNLTNKSIRQNYFKNLLHKTNKSFQAGNTVLKDYNDIDKSNNKINNNISVISLNQKILKKISNEVFNFNENTINVDENNQINPSIFNNNFVLTPNKNLYKVNDLNFMNLKINYIAKKNLPIYNGKKFSYKKNNENKNHFSFGNPKINYFNKDEIKNYKFINKMRKTSIFSIINKNKGENI